MPEEKPMTLADVKAQSQLEKTSSPEEPKAETEVKTEEKPEAEEKVEIDYKAEVERYKLKAERERELRNYEREERKKLQRSINAQTRASEESVTMTSQDLKEEITDLDTLVEQKLQVVRKEQAADLIEDILVDLSSNEHEQALVKAIYENDLKPSGWSKKSIREDLEKAFLIANRDRFKVQAEHDARQKMRKVKAEEVATSHAAQSSVGREPPGTTTPYSQVEQKWLGRVGKTKIDGD